MFNPNIDELALNLVEKDAVALLSVSELILNFESIEDVKRFLSPFISDSWSRLILILILKHIQWVQMIILHEFEASTFICEVQLSDLDKLTEIDCFLNVEIE